ncbi:MAG: SGNH/GDSL hydrolase family protein [Lachnospiraceae bacterium]|nr:SGNH/GDSL hydrolase family protein [Lachnospiraceae bacterium]
MKKVLKYVITIALILVILFFVQKLFMPKYVSDVTEGRLIAEYYEEEMDHDILFVGDCEVYENFVPAMLWTDYGYNSYIRGSAQQLIWQSYYLLEDALRYEKPDVVIFNVLSMKYNEPQKEAYNRMSIEGMRWSKSKVDNIYASMTSKEHFIEYVFPLLRYHSRWSELEEEDIEHIFDTDVRFHNGYYMRVDAKPAKDVPGGEILGNYQFGDNSYKYLDMMTKLCKENDIELILIKAPSLYPYWYPEWEEQMEEYAKKNDLRYINFLELQDECNLNWDEDTYDAGLHLNYYGGQKVTKYLGDYIKNEIGLKSRRGDEKLEKIWNEKLELFNSDLENKLRELEGE